MANEKLRLGGMALRNGLLVHGPGHWAAAVRASDGSVAVFSGRKPRYEGPLLSIPGLRGIIRLAEALILLPLIKKRAPQVQLPFEDGRIVVAMFASSALAAVIRRGERAGAGREAAVALIGIAPTALAMRDSDLAAYHGVEHKSIAAYEQDRDPADTPKEHERCGSNLVAPMMLATIGGNLLARSLVKSRGPVVNMAVTLSSAALAVEVFAWAERHRETSLARAIKRPGYEMQRLFATREPTVEQLEIGRAAMAEILRLETA
ncbi:MAG: DUF1385 domain-containing protein [Solirubrobacterales bacterium]